MEALFWGCFVGGALFAVISALLGDLLGSWLDGVFDFLSVDFLKPIITASAITSFGGAGILLDRYTGLGSAGVVILAIVAAVLLSAVVYFAYVRPMENSENSTGFSESELPGKVGEVTVPIPAQGYGEVMVKLVGGNTLHIASSWDRKEISAGTVVVVIETTKEGTVQVSELYPHPM
ncbi:MAG: protease [Paenibacillaceae bacterium]|uniref:Protease n=1 Tax=Paenibacillus mellifer TaxID=2937794 RepID=A0A9X1XYZ3_9BACL|nr:protease [Paenibacillus mellifer]MBW4838902.1 protease [Paenibacillaceae bacterium]MCK8488545.1 protease [Paenibacillus mellifer]